MGKLHVFQLVIQVVAVGLNPAPGVIDQLVRGRQRSGRKAPGDTTHFQALTTALSGTVGTGNIGGVGLAIFLGGPAALFWMWVTAFVGMAEITQLGKTQVDGKKQANA